MSYINLTPRALIIRKGEAVCGAYSERAFLGLLLSPLHAGLRVESRGFLRELVEAPLAVEDGVVAGHGAFLVHGRYVELVHEDGYTTSYTGLERILVSNGREVKEGDAIGTIGTSSNYYGDSAILFSVSQDGIRINPETVCKF